MEADSPKVIDVSKALEELRSVATLSESNCDGHAALDIVGAEIERLRNIIVRGGNG